MEKHIIRQLFRLSGVICYSGCFIGDFSELKVLVCRNTLGSSIGVILFSTTPQTALPASVITNHIYFISVTHLQKFLLRINIGLDVDVLLKMFRLRSPSWTLGSEVILEPLRCFDMPWYLCLFQLLKTYYWPTCHFFCIQHKLCYNNMWPRWMYMFAFFRKKNILCVVSKFWGKNYSWSKAKIPTLNTLKTFE